MRGHGKSRFDDVLGGGHRRERSLGYIADERDFAISDNRLEHHSTLMESTQRSERKEELLCREEIVELQGLISIGKKGVS